MIPYIPHGSFGGGGGNPPREMEDTVSSIDYAVVELLLGEAPMAGIPDPATQHIFLNGIPIQAKDGTFNYENVQIGWKLTEEMEGANLISNMHAPSEVHVLNQRVMHGDPGANDPGNANNAVVWPLANTEANGVWVTLHFPRLEFIDTEGNTINTRVDFGFAVKSEVEGFWRWIRTDMTPGTIDDVTIFSMDQKSAAGFKNTYFISGLDPALAPYQVRVMRWTPDSVIDRRMDELWVDSYTEVVSLFPQYPGSAILQVGYDARAFESPPEVAVELYTLVVPIPTAYHPRSPDGTQAAWYDPFWDGSFTYGYTTNAAWHYRAMCLNKRWGLGRHLLPSGKTELDVADHVDDASLYLLSKYCDELVLGINGTMEPRYQFNGGFIDRQEAYDTLNNLASSFNGMLFYARARISVAADGPAPVKHLFTPSNIIDGRFQYEGTGKQARRSVVHVAWNDPENEYKQTPEVIQDDELLARYGYVLDEVVAVGCTGQGQAQRVGRYQLESDKLTQSISFRAALEGSVVLPGEIISTADPTRIGKRLGGRIVEATRTDITVDSPVTGLTIGHDHPFFTRAPDGDVNSSFVTIESTSQTVFHLNTTLLALNVPVIGSQWIMSDPAQWRVLGVAEQSDSPGTYQITGAQYSIGKFAAIERQVHNNFDQQFTLITPRTQRRATNLRATERLYLDHGVIKNAVQVAWDEPPGAHKYVFSYSRNGGPFTGRTELSVPLSEFTDLPVGNYVFRVVVWNVLKRHSPVAELEKRIFGKTAPPPDVDHFSVRSLPDGTRVATFSSDFVPLDVQIGGGYVIRYKRLS